MAKNKGTHGRGKAAVEEPDEFVQRVWSLSDALQPHIKKIVALVVVIIGGLVIWKTLDWMHDKKAKGATSAYLTAVKTGEAPIVTPDDPPLPNNVLPPEITFPNEEARRTASLAALNTLASEHSSIALSKLAGPREAKLMLEAGRYDDALAAYKKFASGSAPKPLRMAALEGVGYSLEAKAMSAEDPAARQSGLEAALAAFAELQPNKEGLMRDFSLYHQGRLLVELGKKEDGIAMYKQLLTEVPDSPLTVAVESRLGGLEPSP